MSIDLFTLAAQVVNFLILVFLLRRLFYGPLSRVMEAREQSFKERLSQAEKEHTEATLLQENCQKQLEELEQVRAHKLAEVAQEVENLRRDSITRVRGEVAELERGWKDSQTRELEALGAEETRRVAGVVLQVSKRALSELASADLERQVVNVFLSRLEVGPIPGGAVQISTAFPLPDEDRANLLQRFPEAQFKVEPDLISGIVVRGPDRKLSWNIVDFLGDLSEAIRRC